MTNKINDTQKKNIENHKKQLELQAKFKQQEKERRALAREARYSSKQTRGRPKKISPFDLDAYQADVKAGRRARSNRMDSAVYYAERRRLAAQRKELHDIQKAQWHKDVKARRDAYNERIEQAHKIALGLAPWDPDYPVYKRATKKYIESHGGTYKNLKKPKMRKIMGLGPSKESVEYWVADTDLGVPLGFNETMGSLYPQEFDATNDKSVFDTIEKSFSTYKHKSVDGCGHIAKVEYATYSQILRVTFNQGEQRVCCFFKVPSTVAAELLLFAENKALTRSSVTGKEVHILGVRFWDLIRIRGTKYGARYPFTYSEAGQFTTNKRYDTINNEDFAETAMQQEQKNNGIGPAKSSSSSANVATGTDLDILNQDSVVLGKKFFGFGVIRHNDAKGNNDIPNIVTDKGKEISPTAAPGKAILDNFFDNGAYDNLLPKLKGKKADYLNDAFEDWQDMNYEDTIEDLYLIVDVLM